MWLACDHTRSGRLQIQASLQIPLEENLPENVNPTLRAEGKGSFSWNLVKCFNKPDLARTSKKKTGLFLSVMRIPGCTKTISKSMTSETPDSPAAGTWHSSRYWARRATGKVSHSWVWMSLFPQTQWSQFSRGWQDSPGLALGLSQRLLPGEAVWRGLSFLAPLGAPTKADSGALVHPDGHRPWCPGKRADADQQVLSSGARIGSCPEMSI